MKIKRMIFYGLILLLGTGFIASAQDFPDGLIAYTPDRDCEPYGSCTDGIRIINPNTGEATHIRPEDDSNMVYGETLKFSPDQRYLAYLTYGLMHIVEVATGEEVGTIEFYYPDSPYGGGVWYDWHPTLPLMAFRYQSDFESDIPRNYDLFLFNLLDQTWYPIELDLEVILSGAEWSPDGTSLLISATTSETKPRLIYDLYSYNIITDTLINLTHDPQTYWGGDWSKDSQRVIYTVDYEEKSQIITVDVNTGQKSVIFEDLDASFDGVRWVLDDTAIIYSRYPPSEGLDYESYLLDLTSGEVTHVLAVPPYFVGYDLSPDKTALVYLASPEHEKDVCIVSLITFEETCLQGEKSHHIAYPEWG